MRFWRFLRSRRLAVWLLTGLTAYTVIGSIVPQSSVDAEVVAVWDAAHPTAARAVALLGLHEAFSRPVFLAMCFLVGLSTAVCAWERSARAWRLLRSSGSMGGQPYAVAVPDGLGCTVVAERVEAALRGLRLTVRSDDQEIIGRSGRIGLLGSPLFHWALAALMFSAAVGQLTRYEAVVELALGESVTDSAEALGDSLRRGVAASGYSGDTITFEDVDFAHKTGQTDRGVASKVAVAREGKAVASGWVFPNAPLASGSMMVHQATVEPLALGSISTGEAGPVTPFRLWFRFDDRGERTIDVDTSAGDTASVGITPLGGQRVLVSMKGTKGAETREAGVGERVEFPGDVAVTVDALTYGTQLRLVRDRTLPLVFATLLLLCVGSALTVFVPARSVRIALSDDASAGPHVTMHVGCPRSDPAFPARVREAITTALASTAPGGSILKEHA